MAGGNKNKLSREEELLLQDFSRNVSTKSSALFYGNALIVSAIPICEFCRKTVVIYHSSLFTCCTGMCDVDTREESVCCFREAKHLSASATVMSLLIVCNCEEKLLGEIMLNAISSQHV